MLDAADEHNIVMAAARKHGILMLGDAAQWSHGNNKQMETLNARSKINFQ
jgi:hypothetical protein